MLALDEPLDPPVGVVVAAEVLDRLAGAREVVEVAALHGQPELVVDPLLLALDALGAADRPVRSSSSGDRSGVRSGWSAMDRG